MAGDVCNASNQCASGFCAGGYCCGSFLSSSCTSCSSTGYCLSCALGYTSTATELYTPCFARVPAAILPSCSTGSQCASGICAAGWCCGSPLSNNCTACSEPGYCTSCIAGNFPFQLNLYSYCSVTEVHTLSTAGFVCTLNSDCLSNFCAGGFCCGSLNSQACTVIMYIFINSWLYFVGLRRVLVGIHVL